MVATKTLKSQLARLNAHFWIFGRAEAKELRKILNPGEVIIHCAHGYYHGGSGLLVATNHRLLLIDKRPFYLNLEDMKYHTIKSVDCRQHFLTAMVVINCGAKKLYFKSVSDARLKLITDYIKDELEVAKRRFAQVMSENSSIKPTKSYQNPAWAPHHPVAIRPRSRPSKFYPAARLTTPN